MFKADITATRCQPENFPSRTDLRGTFEEFSRCPSVMAAYARCLDMRNFLILDIPHFLLSALSLSPPSSKIVLIITPGPATLYPLSLVGFSHDPRSPSPEIISAHSSLHRSAPLGSIMK